MASGVETRPGFAVTDADSARRALGDRWELAYRWDLLLDAGVRVIAGSDYPIESLSPLYPPLNAQLVCLGVVSKSESNETR